jgi:hypothetical protein
VSTPHLPGVISILVLGTFLSASNNSAASLREFQCNVMSRVSRNVKIKIYRAIDMPVLYGCETWSLILREVL